MAKGVLHGGFLRGLAPLGLQLPGVAVWAPLPLAAFPLFPPPGCTFPAVIHPSFTVLVWPSPPSTL